jgi:putative ABC transport system permease protein
MAMGALASHKLRSALTLVGVLVGVFSIIVVMTAMRVMQSDVEKEMSQLGGQTFMIQKWPAVYFGGPEGFEKFWRRKNITYAQGVQVEQRATMARSVGLETTFWGGQIETRYKKSAPNVQLFGETPGSFPARNWDLQEGRLLLDVDVDGTRDVCVLGNGLAKTVFPRGSPLGERLKINGINYTVVGVLAPKGGQLNGDQDNFAVVPLTTGMNRFGRWRRSLSILVQARDQASYEDTVEQVRGILRVVRKVPPGKEDDFELFSNDSMISQFNSFTMAVRVGVSAVSSISLLAAGIGIMNIMLVSVTERTREIGIRKALGARREDVLLQFLIEAVTLALVGGVLGVLAGATVAESVTLLIGMPSSIKLWAVAAGLVVAASVGVFFGVYPARKAARLDPIVALRFEM